MRILSRFLFLQIGFLLGGSLYIGSTALAVKNETLETTYTFVAEKTGRNIRLGMRQRDLIIQYDLPAEIYQENGYTICTYSDDELHKRIVLTYFFKDNKLMGFIINIKGNYMKEAEKRLGSPDSSLTQYMENGGVTHPPTPAMKAVLYGKKLTTLSKTQIIIMQMKGVTSFFVSHVSMYHNGISPIKEMVATFTQFDVDVE